LIDKVRFEIKDNMLNIILDNNIKYIIKEIQHPIEKWMEIITENMKYKNEK